MKFKLVIDPEAEEQVVITAREVSPLVRQLEKLVTEDQKADVLTAWQEDTMKLLKIADISCISVQDGKTFAIDRKGSRYRLKHRLYELEQQLPSHFIRINKSALANERHLDRFQASFSGAVDAVFTCGHREYVSRRCFSKIKRRYDVK